ncbi:PQ loop repeat protein [Macrophomina phaseolina]|uniref:PQ loop repeat protein n=1 Tax=Macrophomina phaseolina TaxID=35725 RepID=A0ABQ8FZC0_9PEZI|nr:PQ loop repeat protein [Macrophomina phaseolina]
MDVPVAANVLGTIGAVCWSVQLIPQIIINYRRHHATGLQPAMMMWWAWAGVPLGVYNIVQSFNIALQVQPQILSFLSLVTWIQCYHYQRNWKLLHSLAVIIPIASFMAGIETALVFALRIAVQRDVRWPLTLMAVLAAVFLAAGVLRHYWDIWVHRTVRGISWLFVAIDAAGDLFSLISVFFQPEIDVLGMVTYGVELVLWLGVFVCGGYFNLWPWMKKRAAGRSDRSGSGSEPDGNRVEAARSGVDQSGSSRIQLRDLPSSTSVFRTPSCELALARSRTGGGGR